MKYNLFLSTYLLVSEYNNKKAYTYTLWYTLESFNMLNNQPIWFNTVLYALVKSNRCDQKKQQLNMETKHIGGGFTSYNQ